MMGKYQKRQMSQTSYGNWRDFSSGKKSLADFAPANEFEGSQGRKQSETRGLSLNQSLKDNEGQISSIVISNKKTKKKIKLKPLIPLAGSV
mmetsp:Transcript_10696/g.10811  ORF Transcript_10696/g.10811 Transcript_10696/m.10811 type:complete len:91 (-) Transcript_10696:387-659(-)